MRRGASALTLVAAGLVGVLVGSLLYLRVGALPLPDLGPGGSTADPTGPSSPPAPSASGSPTMSPSPSASASASPSASPSVSPSVSPTPTTPPFTVRALLQPEEFEQYGWAPTTVIETWPGYPDRQVSSCTALRESDGLPVAAHSALYRDHDTTAVETVARFTSAAAAKAAVMSLRQRIDDCPTEPEGDPDLTAEPMDAPDPQGISTVDLWDTTGVDAAGEGVIGVARAGDRVAFLTMVSVQSDPLDSTDVGALMLLAGQRLV